MAIVVGTKFYGKTLRDFDQAEYTIGSKKVIAQAVYIPEMGEVQTTPTTNTLLGRVKAIVTTLAAGIPIFYAGPSWTQVFGIAGARFTSADQSAAAVAITDAPTSGQKLVIDSVLLSAGATAQAVSLKEETSGTILATIYLPVNGTFNWIPVGKLKLATADKKLTLQDSASGNISASAFYHSEA